MSSSSSIPIDIFRGGDGDNSKPFTIATVASADDIAAADYNEKHCEWRDPVKIVTACQYGDLDFIKKSVEEYGVDPNAKDSEDCSLLHWAAVNNRVRVVRFLLLSGADPNITGGVLKETPLQWVSRHDNYAFMIRVLVLEGQANITNKNTLGQDALSLACQFGCLKISFILLSYGADPNVKDKFGDAPIMRMAKMSVLHGVSESSYIPPLMCHPMELQRILLNFGADPETVDQQGNNIFHIITNRGGKSVNFQAAFDIYEAVVSNKKATSKNSMAQSLSPSSFLTAKNASNKSPWLISYESSDLMTLQFLFDCFLYGHLHYIFPTVLVVLLCCSACVILHKYYWFYGSFFIVCMFLLFERLSQPSIPSSRVGNGISWGIITAILGSFVYYIMPLVDIKHTITAIVFFSTIMCSLYLACVISPGHIHPKEVTYYNSNSSISSNNSNNSNVAAHSNPIVNSDLLNGIFLKAMVDGNTITMEDQNDPASIKSMSASSLPSPSFSSDSNDADPTLRTRNKLNKTNATSEVNFYRSNDRQSNLWNNQIRNAFGKVTESSNSYYDQVDENEVDWRFVKPVKFCTSCVVDRSHATTHCALCNICVLDLDHHCAFVNNCVGTQNRWYFILFTGSATFGCLYFVLLALWAEYNFYNGSTENGVFGVQMYVLFNIPALMVTKIAALVCVLWIGSLFITQVYFISMKTSSYMIMKGKHKQKFCPVTKSCLVRGVFNFIDFLKTGKSEIRPADTMDSKEGPMADNHIHSSSCNHNHLSSDHKSNGNNTHNNIDNNNNNDNSNEIGGGKYHV